MGLKLRYRLIMYTFAWKKSIEKYRARLHEKILKLVSNFNRDF